MSLSQGALDAGAQAAIKVFTDAGFGAFIDMDKARGLAAPIIRAADEYRKQNEWLSQQKAAIPVPPPMVDTDPSENAFASFIRNLVSQVTKGK